MIIIVGAGIAGSILSKLLKYKHIDYVLVDDNDEFSASKASSNLYHIDWMKKFIHQGARNGLEVIEKLYRPVSVFDSGILSAMKVKHIRKEDLLITPDVIDTVSEVTSRGVTLSKGDTIQGTPVLCCGWRGRELAPFLQDVYVKVGHCFFIEGKLNKGQSSLNIVSPYKHGKLFQYGPNTIYYADSVALQMKDFYKRQTSLKEQTLNRFKKVSKISKPVIKEYRVGYRPCVKGNDFGILEESNGVYVMNGGGKNGILAYAHLAQQLLERIK